MTKPSLMMMMKTVPEMSLSDMFLFIIHHNHHRSGTFIDYIHIYPIIIMFMYL